MRQSGQEDKKKIKTESGRYISSSYKRDLYPGAGGGQRGRSQAPSIATSIVGGGGVRKGRGLAPQPPQLLQVGARGGAGSSGFSHQTPYR